ncbi:MAG: hypothetical protein IPO38_06725 [Rhodocyclaceae bacterium]|nr:hypothetical protein [Rhodocyclaceae bacterium]MBP6108737.1 hypothetical protein [Rhodocyclaceae bacterium]
MKSNPLKSLLFVTTVVLVSLVTVAQTLPAHSSEDAYPEVPALPPYIYMSDSFQVYAITAP